MTPVLVLARNTYREAIRDRLLTTVLLFGSAIVASSVVLAPLTLGEETRVVRDLGLAAISVFTMLLIVMVGTGMVFREIERQTIHTILTLPVKRFQFILGKFLGFSATILTSIGLLSTVYLIIVGASGGGVNASLFVAIAVTALEAIIVTAIAIFFSTVASPLLSAVFTFLVYVSGHLAGEVRALVERHGDTGLQAAADVMYFVLPSLHHFDVRNELVAGVAIPAAQVGYCCLYTLLFTGGVLLVTIAAFQRRDFE